MAITAEQAAQLASTYQAGDTSGLQGLVNQMGVTQADVAQYFPGFDVGSLQGITLAPSDAQKAAQATQGSYSDIKPGNIDIGMMPSTYGTKGLTGDVISSFISANLQSPELIAQKAQEFGLSAADIQKAAGYAPEQQARYLSYSGVSPTGIAGLTPLTYGQKGEFTAKDILDYIGANLEDKTRVAQAAQRYGITPEQLRGLYAETATPYDLGAIQQYLSQGQAGLGTRIEDIIKSTIGDANLISTIEGSLPTSISKLSSFTPTSLANKSIEEIERLIAESPTNKLQEAGRVRGLVQSLYGVSDADAKKLASDLFAGKDTDDFAESIYKDLLNKGFTRETQTKLLQDAAARAPGSEYFKENPDQLLKYSPLEKKTGSSGQYGYVNNAPILNATFADQKLGDKNQVIPHLGQDSDFGWMTNSKYAETLARGPAVFGIEFNNRNDIEKAIDFERRIKDGTIINDPEGGYYDTVKNIGIEAPKSDNERKNYNPYSSDTLAKLQEAAQKAGLNPANYKSAGDLFDALEKKTENIYQVVGRAINWDPEAAKNLGITQTTSGRGGVNHANVLYERIGDKLVPINAKAFEFHDPNTSRGAIGDFFQGIASIPFVAELALLNPATAAYYPVIKGAQTMALGGDLGDAIKAGGLAWLTTQFIPNEITPQLSTTLATNPLVQQLSTIDTRLANFVIDSGTRAIISSGLAAITGQDPEKAALNALITSGIGTMTNEGLNLTNIPEQYRGIVSNIISSTILGQDPKKSLAGAATNLLMGELKDFGREMIKSDQDKDRSKEIRI